MINALLMDNDYFRIYDLKNANKCAKLFKHYIIISNINNFVTHICMDF